MTQPSQNANQSPKRPADSQPIATDKDDADQPNLEKDTKRLRRYGIICGACGSGFIIGYGICIAKFIIHCNSPYATDLSAAVSLIPLICFDVIVAVPLGMIVGIITILQLRKYKTFFGKIPFKAWLIFGIILCLMPAVLTILAYLALQIIWAI